MNPYYEKKSLAVPPYYYEYGQGDTGVGGMSPWTRAWIALTNKPEELLKPLGSLTYDGWLEKILSLPVEKLPLLLGIDEIIDIEIEKKLKNMD